MKKEIGFAEKSIQLHDDNPPKDNARHMVMSIYCVTCSALRTYKVTQNADLIQRREIGSLAIKVDCENCEKTIAVYFGWDNCPEENWSYRLPTMIEENAGMIGVADSAGLRTPTLEEEK